MSTRDPRRSCRARLAGGFSTLALLAMTASFARAQSCPTLSAADVEKISGVHVQQVPFGSKPGAGGKCANFAMDNGRLFLGVSGLASAADYATAVAAVPQVIYPQRESLKDVGDEAVLMKGAGGAPRYLVARKGDHGVIIFPFGPQPDDTKLKQLAVAALPH